MYIIFALVYEQQSWANSQFRLNCSVLLLVKPTRFGILSIIVIRICLHAKVIFVRRNTAIIAIQIHHSSSLVDRKCSVNLLSSKFKGKSSGSLTFWPPRMYVSTYNQVKKRWCNTKVYNEGCHVTVNCLVMLVLNYTSSEVKVKDNVMHNRFMFLQTQISSI